MAAGLGFKDFVTGEVLTAADVDGYLMQGVWVFASATARDAAVTSPQEGNFAYLKDTNVTTYYTGSAWANLDTTGMTNPMTTTGDTIYSSSGSTPARLGIGTAGQVLQVNSGATAPEWATPSAGGGGLDLISTTSFSAVASQSVNDVFSATYDNYVIKLNSTTFSTSTGSLDFRLRVGGTDTTTNYRRQRITGDNTTLAGLRNVGTTSWETVGYVATTFNNESTLVISNPFKTVPTSGVVSLTLLADGNIEAMTNFYGLNNSTSYTGFTLICPTTMTGSVSVYGYKK
jgi:hypothetical protein